MLSQSNQRTFNNKTTEITVTNQFEDKFGEDVLVRASDHKFASKQSISNNKLNLMSSASKTKQKLSTVRKTRNKIKPQSFVPYVSERDKLGKLIDPSAGRNMDLVQTDSLNMTSD